MTGLGGTVWWWVSGGVAVVVVAGVTTLALAAVGRRKDGSPGRQAALGGARSLVMLMDGNNLVEAFRAAGAIGKAEGLLMVERPGNDATGWTNGAGSAAVPEGVRRHRQAGGAGVRAGRQRGAAHPPWTCTSG
ncbi:hypothetical protein ACWEFJ_04210 [Actinosynnema sp. NPDC004786]